MEIWSGGQTGVDRAALDVAMELGFPTGGWIPRGRLAEDGPVPARYASLREADSEDYSNRTFLNVRDTDATLILRWGPATGGTLETIEFARQLERPVHAVDLSAAPSHEGALSIRAWLGRSGRIERLNVAGPRASTAPGAHDRARQVLRLALVSVAMDEGRLTNAAADVAIMRKDESGRPRVAERRSDRWSNPAGRLREVVETTTRRVKDMVRGEAGQGGRLESEAPAHGDEVDLPIDELMREVDAESERMVARLEQKASETVRQSASTDDDRRRLDEILSAMQQEADDLAAHADQVLEDAIGWMARAESAVRTNDDNAAKEYLDKYQEAVLVAEGLQADAQAAREAVAAYRAAVRNRVAE